MPRRTYRGTVFREGDSVTVRIRIPGATRDSDSAPGIVRKVLRGGAELRVEFSNGNLLPCHASCASHVKPVNGPNREGV